MDSFVFSGGLYVLYLSISDEIFITFYDKNLWSRSSAADVSLENTKIENRAQSHPWDLFRLSVSQKICFRKSKALTKTFYPGKTPVSCFCQHCTFSEVNFAWKRDFELVPRA